VVDHRLVEELMCPVVGIGIESFAREEEIPESRQVIL
jgi:hypothetical protein